MVEKNPHGKPAATLKWKQFLTWPEVAETLGVSVDCAETAGRRYKKANPKEFELIESKEFHGISAVPLMQAIARRPKTLTDLSNRFDRSLDTVRQAIKAMIKAGYGIKREDHWVIKKITPPVEDTQIKTLFKTGAKTVDVNFGVVSDTHAGSYYEQITALEDFVKTAYDEYNVRHMMHVGDAFAGIKVYRGQASEVYAYTGTAQAEAVANNLPWHPDLKWYMLGGNHDYSFYKEVGIDVRTLLAGLGRDDIQLLPYDAANLPLLPDIDAHLWHPIGGIPYAVSYRAQKGAEQLASKELMDVVMGTKPKPSVRLILCGHLHVIYMLDHGPMVVLGAGCFEGQTSLLKRLGKVPQIGGWIVRCRFVDGMLYRLDTTRIRYPEIQDDWRSYYAKRQAEKSVEVFEPIFSLDRSKIEQSVV